MRVFSHRTFAVAVATYALFACQDAGAVVVITAYEQGGSTIFSSDGGTLDLSSWDPILTGTTDIAAIRPAHAQINLGGGIAVSNGTTAIVDMYKILASNLVSPGSFALTACDNCNAYKNADIGFGGMIGIGWAAYGFPNNMYTLLEVTSGYSSGELLGPIQSTYLGSSLASLNLKTGTYTWSWGSDTNADSIVLNVSDSPTQLTPVPGPLPILGIPTFFGFSRKLRKRIKLARGTSLNSSSLDGYSNEWYLY